MSMTNKSIIPMITTEFLSECIKKASESDESITNTIVFPNCFIDTLSENEKILCETIKTLISEENYNGASSLINLILTHTTKSKIVNKLLIESCEKGNMVEFTFLIAQGANIEYDNNMPFVTACLHGNLNLITAFIEYGVKPNMVPYAFVMAAMNEQKETILELIKNGLNINLNDCEVLKVCVVKGLTEMVDFLVKLGPKLEPHIDRLLIISTERGYIDIIRILLEYMSDSISVSKRQVLRPTLGKLDKYIDIAKKNNYTDIEELLDAKKTELINAEILQWD